MNGFFRLNYLHSVRLSTKEVIKKNNISLLCFIVSISIMFCSAFLYGCERQSQSIEFLNDFFSADKVLCVKSDSCSFRLNGNGNSPVEVVSDGVLNGLKYTFDESGAMMEYHGLNVSVKNNSAKKPFMLRNICSYLNSFLSMGNYSDISCHTEADGSQIYVIPYPIGDIYVNYDVKKTNRLTLISDGLSFEFDVIV